MNLWPFIIKNYKFYLIPSYGRFFLSFKRNIYNIIYTYIYIHSLFFFVLLTTKSFTKGVSI